MKSGINVLIVEDELIIAMDLKMILQRHGYTVIKLDVSGEDAIKTATTCQPDVVLMDINLKGKINGIQAAEKIIPHKIPVIFVTSQKDEATTKQIEKVSPHYVFKPYSQDAICRVIDMVLRD